MARILITEFIDERNRTTGVRCVGLDAQRIAAMQPGAASGGWPRQR